MAATLAAGLAPARVRAQPGRRRVLTAATQPARHSMLQCPWRPGGSQLRPPVRAASCRSRRRMAAGQRRRGRQQQALVAWARAQSQAATLLRRRHTGPPLPPPPPLRSRSCQGRRLCFSRSTAALSWAASSSPATRRPCSLMPSQPLVALRLRVRRHWRPLRLRSAAAAAAAAAVPAEVRACRPGTLLVKLRAPRAARCGVRPCRRLPQCASRWGRCSHRP